MNELTDLTRGGRMESLKCAMGHTIHRVTRFEIVDPYSLKGTAPSSGLTLDRFCKA
jgi:hypothetical protein